MSLTFYSGHAYAIGICCLICGNKLFFGMQAPRIGTDSLIDGDFVFMDVDPPVKRAEEYATVSAVNNEQTNQILGAVFRDDAKLQA